MLPNVSKDNQIYQKDNWVIRLPYMWACTQLYRSRPNCWIITSFPGIEPLPSSKLEGKLGVAGCVLSLP